VIDLKWAARACSNFATLQFQVREIAAGLLERPSLAIHRDLAAALYEASQGGR
jgi:hypothetical protein